MIFFDICIQRLHESWRRACYAWGWDFDKKQRLNPMPSGCKWTNWDVRLAKMIRCSWLFEQEDALSSLQAFAKDLLENEKRGLSFTYGSIDLNEILIMTLPRRDSASDKHVDNKNVDSNTTSSSSSDFQKK